MKKTNDEWKKELTEEQYRVLREAGTEKPFSGEFTMFNKEGEYICAACGNKLFDSKNKFQSSCGWPSFDDVKSSESVYTRLDTSFGMEREEIICAGCDGHLGHVFTDGPTDTTGLRYCINSVALDFKPQDESR